MKYKVGDRIKIIEDMRSWDEWYHTTLQQCDPPYVVTITEVCSLKENTENKGRRDICGYMVEEFSKNVIWYEDEITGLREKLEPINNRFEILDL